MPQNLSQPYFDTSEHSSFGYDPTLDGFGSGPDGSRFSSFVRIPAAPTLTPQTRYLCLLACQYVPPKSRAIVRNLRLAALIGPQPEDGKAPIVLQQTSPFWRFAKGNLMFGLRKMVDMGRRSRQNISTPAGYSSPGINATMPGVLFDPGSDPNIAYVPPAGGELPGAPLGASLGRFWDVRFPWALTSTLNGLGIIVDGPAHVCLYVSVWQPDPEQPVPYPDGSKDVLSPEDRFVSTYTKSQYIAVAGAIDLDDIGAVCLGCDNIKCSCRTKRGRRESKAR